MNSQKLFFIVTIILLLALSARANSDTQTNALVQMGSHALPADEVRIDLQFSHPIKQPPKSFVLKQPTPKIILDFVGVRNQVQKSLQQIDIGTLQSITVVEANNRTRVILGLKHNAHYETKLNGSHVYITLGAARKDLQYQAIRPNLAAQLPQKKLTKKSLSTVPSITIKNIDFQRNPQGGGRVILSFTSDKLTADVNERAGEIDVKFLNTEVPSRWQRQLDVTDFNTPVSTIRLVKQGSNAHLLVKAIGDYQPLTYQVNQQFIIDVKPLTKQQAQVKRKQQYDGKRISLNFQDIKVRAVLQLLADFTGLNVVVSDSVDGNITLRLNNVPWDQALDIILKTRGLDKRQLGNVLLIAPTAEIAQREQQELQAQQQVTELEPLRSELMQINYARAADIAGLLKTEGSSFLSARGIVSVDERTNTLWIQDTGSKLNEVRRIISQLDIPVRQVLIEARVVNVDRDFTRDLGVRFGLSKPADRVSGSLEGANTLAGGTAIENVPINERLNFDLGITGTNAATAGSIGLALARLSGNILLDLELSAAETEGRGKIISSPRLLTANQQPATIERGEEIPYQEATSSGATSVAFKKAVLSLSVTPQITPDDKIILKLTVNQDQRSSAPPVLGVPAIDTRRIETQVLVNNGETIVLGGIYEQDKTHQVRRIPFLGKLPVVGHLFRNTAINNNKTELLIFVTPRIVKQTLHNG
ncbi:MAG: type IV pilus secretin PilQ [Gammaproteobacteria bacterium]